MCLNPSRPEPGQREKFKLIFILIQLSKMHGAGRVKMFLKRQFEQDFRSIG